MSAIVLKINGQVVIPNSVNETTTIYTGGLQFGYHNVTIELMDNLSNSNNFTWYFNVTASLNDINKFYVKNSTGNAVAWFGDLGNIVLKGTCTVESECNAPDNSFIIKNDTGAVNAYIDSEGNMCLETGDCSDESASCSPANAFIVKNEAGTVISHIEVDGDLCLIGSLVQNGNP